jgi:hypothetical protein
MISLPELGAGVYEKLIVFTLMAFPLQTCWAVMAAAYVLAIDLQYWSCSCRPSLRFSRLILMIRR